MCILAQYQLFSVKCFVCVHQIHPRVHKFKFASASYQYLATSTDGNVALGQDATWSNVSTQTPECIPAFIKHTCTIEDTCPSTYAAASLRYISVSIDRSVLGINRADATGNGSSVLTMLAAVYAWDGST